MTLSRIIQSINDKLAGELLTYDALKTHIDSVIDDINTSLNAKFPVITDFDATSYPDKYPNYDFIPDKYIRSVVIPGAAYKFYVTDEEGIQTAQQYSYDYSNAMFYMIRDYTAQVPLEYQDTDSIGCVISPSNLTNILPDYMEGE